ncbi:MAG: hypothetical protein ACRDIF_00745 [Actinomycetota bacterium]
MGRLHGGKLAPTQGADEAHKQQRPVAQARLVRRGRGGRQHVPQHRRHERRRLVGDRGVLPPDALPHPLHPGVVDGVGHPGEAVGERDRGEAAAESRDLGLPDQVGELAVDRRLCRRQRADTVGGAPVGEVLEISFSGL